MCRSIYVYSYPLFQLLYLRGSEAVGLSDERNDVHFVLQGLHELDIDWTKPRGGRELHWACMNTCMNIKWLVCMRCDLPVSERGDEVEAAVHPVVLDILPVESALVSEVLFELQVDVVRHCPPTARHKTRVSNDDNAARYLMSCCSVYTWTSSSGRLALRAKLASRVVSVCSQACERLKKLIQCWYLE